MPVDVSLAAGRWLLGSGIQQPSGGFARFYDAEARKNKPISTEISGYAASALVYLFRTTGDQAYLDAARRTAGFLASVWEPRLRTFPYEHASPSPETDHLSYFFDCGIIVRGLLAVWRETKSEQLIEISRQTSLGMIADFHAGGDYHPIVELPAKAPLPRTDQWSRAPGCYQLKSAMAWWEVAEITGDTTLRDAYLELLDAALETHALFLPGASSQYRVMDRLHAYCYFLEGLLPVLDRSECVRAYREGIATTARLLNEIAPVFARSDVYAQLLRARINGADAIPLETRAAATKADCITAFQIASEDPRIDGGFSFGRRDGVMSPHMNPVSTVFALQALEMWRQYQAGTRSPCIRMLI